MIGLAVGVLIFCIVKKRNFFDVGDILTLPVPVTLGLGRWGNFVNGELWGRPTSVPWGVIFSKIPGSKWISVKLPLAQEIMKKTGLTALPGQNLINLPRHPSQIYELLLEGVVLFSVLLIIKMATGKTPRGVIISSFLTGYGLIRIFIEFFREPDQQIGYLFGGWLTMGMTLSFFMVLIGISALVYFILNKKSNELWG